MPSLKEKIIRKIQSSDDEQLLAELSRILETKDFVFSETMIRELREADAALEKGQSIGQEQVETELKKWLKGMR